jgi:phage-related protein
VLTLYKLTKGLKEFTEKLILSDEAGDKLYSIISGVFSVFDFGINVVTGLYKAFSPLLTLLKPLADVVLSVASFFGALVTNLNNALKKAGAYEKFGQILFAIVSIPIRLILNNLEVVKTVVSTIINLASLVHKVFSTVFSGIATIVVSVVNGFKKSESPVKSFGEVIQNVFGFINKIIDDLKEKLSGVGTVFEFIGTLIGKLSGLVGRVFNLYLIL